MLSSELITTEAHDLDRIGRALNSLPNLTTENRAAIFAAMEVPTSENRAAWVAAKSIDLAGGTLLHPFTLAQAVRWVPWPNSSQILAGLNRAIGTLT